MKTLFLRALSLSCVVAAAFVFAPTLHAQSAVAPEAKPKAKPDMKGFSSTSQLTLKDSALFEAVYAIATKKFTARQSLRASDWDGVRKTLDSGATARYADSNGSTTLMLMSFNLPFADDATLQKTVARADLDAQDSAGSTALHIAAREGYFKMVRLLVKAGAKLNLTNKEGQTPLDLANKYHRGLAGFILTQARAKNAADLKTPAATPSTPTSSTQTPIVGAAKIADARLYYALDDLHLGDISEKKMIGASLGSENQYWTEVQEALRDGAPVRFTVHYGGITSLMLVSFGIPGADDRVVKQIIARAELNAQDRSGQSALRTAAFYNNLKMVGWLIDAGAELNLVDKSNRTALDWARLNKRIGKDSDAVIALLEKAGAKSYEYLRALSASTTPSSTPSTPAPLNDKSTNALAILVIRSVSTFDTKEAEALLQNGANVNSSDKQGKTLLMTACFNGNVPAVAWLLSKKAAVNATNSSGMTALMLAAMSIVDSDAAQIVEQLMSAGASINAKNKYNLTALDFAKRNNATAAILRKAGAKTYAELK